MKEFNIDKLLGINPDEQNEETSEIVEPVIEKVSLADIQNEKKQEGLEEALKVIEEFLNLSEEEQDAVEDIICSGGKK